MRIGCHACDQTVAQACLTPPALCGLCQLLGPDQVRAYWAKWNGASLGDLEHDRQEDAAA